VVELEVWPDLKSGRVGLFACDGKLRRETPAINSLHTADDYDLDLGIGLRALGAGVGGMGFMDTWNPWQHSEGYCT
jgi:hypothetical protein